MQQPKSEMQTAVSLDIYPINIMFAIVSHRIPSPLDIFHTVGYRSSIDPAERACVTEKIMVFMTD